eukprot:987289-Rhodomonas_salina.1
MAANVGGGRRGHGTGGRASSWGREGGRGRGDRAKRAWRGAGHVRGGRVRTMLRGPRRGPAGHHPLAASARDSVGLGHVRSWAIGVLGHVRYWARGVTCEAEVLGYALGLGPTHALRHVRY